MQSFKTSEYYQTSTATSKEYHCCCCYVAATGSAYYCICNKSDRPTAKENDTATKTANRPASERRIGDQPDNASLYACSAGYYAGYRMMCSPCESNLPELKENGINVK